MRLGLAPLVLGLAACGDGRPSGSPVVQGDPDSAATLDDAGADAPQASYAIIEVVDGGSLVGTVRYGGVVPEARTVSVTEDTATCGASQLVQSVRVGPDGGLADAVVSLVDISRGAAPVPAMAPTLDQRGCTFRPHVLLAPTGATVQVLNSDPLTHNVHTAAFDNRSVNRTQPTGMGAIELNFDAPEKVKIKCDLHPWMSAWIIVTDHPYHAVTDENGSFSLSNIPAGSYTVEVWHESLGARSQMVTVAAGEVHDMAIDLAGGD